MIATPFTRLVGCGLPIQLAAMPGIGGPDLCCAVADAGGLGMLGQVLDDPEGIARTFDAVVARTQGVVGANFLMPFLNEACIDAIAGKVRVVEFFFGDPDARLVERARRGGALVSWQVGSAAEARAAADAGCDFIVAQGMEAGGHVRGHQALLPLLAEVLDTVQVPVVASGGIATGRSLAAVLAAGAGGARVGTRLLASRESEAHPDYLARVLAADACDTVLTETFSEMWPDAPHRVLRSSVEAACGLGAEIAGETVIGGMTLPVRRFSVIPPSRTATGRVDAMALYAGESVGAIHDIRPAADIVREMVGDAERLLAR